MSWCSSQWGAEYVSWLSGGGMLLLLFAGFEVARLDPHMRIPL
jgi:hypothetical protein